MIHAARGARSGLRDVVRVSCDWCGREKHTAVPMIYVLRGGPKLDRGAIVKAMVAKGWGFDATHGERLLCPGCEERRAFAHRVSRAAPYQEKTEERAMKGPQGAATLPLREPTQEQRGDIIEMLVACYDRRAGRYRGADTDKTVADAVGGGCLPGWVARIRGENFGAAGGNEELDGVTALVGALDSQAVALEGRAAALVGEVAELRKAATDLTKRLAVMQKAIGPRADR